MGNFLFGLLFPPVLAILIVLSGVALAHLMGVRVLPRSYLRQIFHQVWLWQATMDTAIAFIPPRRAGGIIGSIASAVICLLLDDDMRKKGKKAAKLLGDKSRRIFESMRERMRVLEPLPGLSSFR